MNKKIKEYFKSDIFWKETGLPFALAFTLSSAVFEAYGQGIFSVWTIPQLAIIIFAFLLFPFIRKHNVIGGILYVAIGFLCLSLMFRFIFEGDWGTGFQSWFLSGGSESAGLTRYYLALLVSFPIFLASVVYYFSAVLYRTSFLMLSSLIPCALYVKILSDMSNMYLVLIAGLNIAIYAVNNRDMNLGREKGKRTGLAAAAGIAAITLVIASLFPKQGEAIYYEVFENIFMNAGMGGGGGFNRLGERSGNAGDFRDLSNTPLYDVYAEDLLYLRRQSFDMYDPQQHNWYALGKYSTPDPLYYEELYSRQELLDYGYMLEAIKRGCELDESLAEDFHIKESLLSMTETGEQRSKATVIPLSHPANYMLTSVRSFSAGYGPQMPPEEQGVFSTRHRQLMSGTNLLSANTPYYIDYFREFTSRSKWILAGGTDFTDEEYGEFLGRLYDVLDEADETELCRYVNAFADDFSDALDYKDDFSENLSGIPSDIAELAQTITADCTYDWEKADAIQAYFHSGDFIYDLEYIPPEGYNTASFFVFTSKRGTCSDFATAYTLMARSVGLIVRYTEGFAPDYTTERGIYRVHSSGSHAYPEVYLPDMGWIVFEPTVSSMYSIEFGNEAAQQNTQFRLTFDGEIIANVLRFVLIAAVIAAAVMFAAPAGSAVTDMIKISRGGKEAFVVMLRRIRKKLSRRQGSGVYAMTAAELTEAAKVYGCDISGFTEIYGRICFGGAEPTETEFTGAKEIYSAFMKQRQSREARRSVTRSK